MTSIKNVIWVNVFDGNRIRHVGRTKVDWRSINGTGWIFLDDWRHVDLEIKLRVVFTVVGKRYSGCFCGRNWWSNFMDGVDPSSSFLREKGEVNMSVLAFLNECLMTLRNILVNDFHLRMIRAVVDVIFLYSREVDSGGELHGCIISLLNRGDRSLLFLVSFVYDLINSTDSFRLRKIWWSHVVEWNSPIILSRKLIDTLSFDTIFERMIWGYSAIMVIQLVLIVWIAQAVKISSASM